VIDIYYPTVQEAFLWNKNPFCNRRTNLECSKQTGKTMEKQTVFDQI